jgi:hypothetical protein
LYKYFVEEAAIHHPLSMVQIPTGLSKILPKKLGVEAEGIETISDTC